MKKTLLVMSALLSTASAFAGKCPDLSGTFSYESGTEKQISTLTQVGCESITTVDQYNGGQPSTTTLKADGIPRQDGSTSMITVRFEGDTLLVQYLGVSLNSIPGSSGPVSFSTELLELSLDANRNLVIAAQDYDAKGNLLTTIFRTLVRK